MFSEFVQSELFSDFNAWKGGRVVEGTGLENHF
jgi:hypothetical protein